MAKKPYTEPTGFIPKDVRKKYGLGEYAKKIDLPPASKVTKKKGK